MNRWVAHSSHRRQNDRPDGICDHPCEYGPTNAPPAAIRIRVGCPVWEMEGSSTPNEQLQHENGANSCTYHLPADIRNKPIPKLASSSLPKLSTARYRCATRSARTRVRHTAESTDAVKRGVYPSLPHSCKKCRTASARFGPSHVQVAAKRASDEALSASEAPTVLNRGMSERLSPTARHAARLTSRAAAQPRANAGLARSSASWAMRPVNTPSTTSSSGPHHPANPKRRARYAPIYDHAHEATYGTSDAPGTGRAPGRCRR